MPRLILLGTACLRGSFTTESRSRGKVESKEIAVSARNHYSGKE